MIPHATEEKLDLNPDLDFAKKYTPVHARQYFQKHRRWLNQLSNWREIRMAKQALRKAGDPQSVLDIPCGTGRFWELLASAPKREIHAVDLNQPMLDIATEVSPPELLKRINIFRSSAFGVDCPDGFVDCVLCMRLFHHMEKSEHRQMLLRELARVSRSTVIVSLWIDGNFKSWRWRRKGRVKAHKNRFVVARSIIESEFQRAGLRVMDLLQLLPGYSSWGMYVLRKSA